MLKLIYQGINCKKKKEKSILFAALEGSAETSLREVLVLLVDGLGGDSGGLSLVDGLGGDSGKSSLGTGLVGGR